MRTSYTVPGTSDAPLLQRLVNQVLSLIQGDLRYVPRTQRCEAYSAVVPGDPVTVRHSLGRRPTSFTWTTYEEMNVWAMESDRALWDAQKIVVRGSVASVKMELFITVDDE